MIKYQVSKQRKILRNLGNMEAKKLNNEIILNDQQQEIYNEMMNGKSLFITGPSGTGKSELIKKFYRDMISPTKEMEFFGNIALTSTTGISAFNIGSAQLCILFRYRFGNRNIGNII